LLAKDLHLLDAVDYHKLAERTTEPPGAPAASAAVLDFTMDRRTPGIKDVTARWLPIVYFLLLPVPVLSGEPGLPDFHEVDPNVYRGRQPAPEGYASLAKMGIKTVIDLRGGWLHVPHERRLVREAGMR